jgi:hypothetical protein
MTWRAALAAGAMAAAAGAAAAQQPPVTCGEPYLVRRGDTLQKIAVRAYGPGASFRDLLAPNASLFARIDPSALEPGMTVAVPCREPPAQAAAAPVPAVAPPPASEGPPAEAAPLFPPPPPGAAPAPPPEPAPPRTLRVAVAAAPVGEPDLPRRVAEAAAAGGPLRLDAIEDRDAHLGPLLREGFYAASLPWLMPDCAAAVLPDRARALCDGALWSAPIAEVAVASFTAARPADGPLCAQAALAPIAGADARLELDPADCLRALVAGEAGRAMVEAGAADAAIPSLGIAGELREDLGAFRVATLHAVALAGSADGAAALAALDLGLAALPPDRRRGLGD